MRNEYKNEATNFAAPFLYFMKHYTGKSFEIPPDNVHTDNKVPDIALDHMMSRLANGDWGEVSPAVAGKNESIIQHGNYRHMIMGSYTVGESRYEVSVELETNIVKGKPCRTARFVNVSCVSAHQRLKGLMGEKTA